MSKEPIYKVGDRRAFLVEPDDRTCRWTSGPEYSKWFTSYAANPNWEENFITDGSKWPKGVAREDKNVEIPSGLYVCELVEIGTDEASQYLWKIVEHPDEQQPS